MTCRSARETIEAWRYDYNHLRPHSSLGALTPMEFACLKNGKSNRPWRAKATTDSTYDLPGIGVQASSDLDDLADQLIAQREERTHVA